MMKFKPKKSELLAILLWALSFLLAFNISPNSRYIWLPDILLLLGFFPILIARRARWLWLAFGIGNIVIGWTLALSSVIADAYFVSYNMVSVKKHLELYHPFIVWLLLGVIAVLIGLVLLTVSLIRWLYNRIKPR